MNSLLIRRGVFLFILIFSLNCTITLRPKINVNIIDTTDTLEKQILGDFKIVENKMLYYEDDSKKIEKSVPKSEQDFYLAMKNRIFFSTKIKEFLKKKYIGEGENGRLKILLTDKENIIYRDVEDTMDIENKAREEIIDFVSQKQNISQKAEYWKTFHQIQVKNMVVGTLFEDNNIWKEKK
ncbi:DUF1318 domain-containing protein [bacterium]|nr:DUF1318 domain-containing protein [bacterium]